MPQSRKIDELFQNPPPFRFYDTQHLVTLALGVLFTVWLVFSAKRFPRKLTDWQARIMAVVLFSIYPLNLLWIYPNMGAATPLPMHLCGWSAITGGIALLTRRRIFAELTYFWALAGATNALITPDLGEGFPHPRFIVFFVHHAGVIAVAIWLSAGMGLYPRKGSVWKIFLVWTQVYLVTALLVNGLTGHNYGFLRHKPDDGSGGSMLDFLGPWPVYIIWMELICLVFFLLLDLPWRFVRRKKGRNE
ncbi:MAG: TIGR02206 family membrane protein [Verrucomicrobiales bacterium]|nr:TIGR02206 family membrane protein [Verrucomicrobiales bacterium]